MRVSFAVRFLSSFVGDSAVAEDARRGVLASSPVSGEDVAEWLQLRSPGGKEAELVGQILR
jgi:hypothetical protein